VPRYVVADDLTGACEAALAYAKRGARTCAWLDEGPPEAGSQAAASEVLCFDLDSRELPPARAYKSVTAFLERLRPQKPSDIIVKIDSTLRGNVASTTHALLNFFPTSIAIVAASYPAQGRVIRDGVLVERGRREGATRVADRFAPTATVSIGLTLLRAEGSILAAITTSLRENDARIAVADAETDADLRALVAAARDCEDILWIGSAGVIEALAAAALGDASRSERRQADGGATRVLFLIGSRSGTTREQVDDFRDVARVETIDASALARRDAEVGTTIARVAHALDSDLVALLAIGADEQPDERVLRSSFVAASAALVRERPGLTVVLSGGATARAFCAEMGIVGLEIRDELAAGIPRSRAIGAPVTIVTKAGGFGTREAYREVLSMLRERQEA